MSFVLICVLIWHILEFFSKKSQLGYVPVG